MTRKEKLIAIFESTIGLNELPEEVKADFPFGTPNTFDKSAHLISGSTKEMYIEFVKLFGIAIDGIEQEKGEGYTDQELERFFIGLMMKAQGGQGTGWNAVKK